VRPQSLLGTEDPICLLYLECSRTFHLQEKLEPAYRSELQGAYGIQFTSLLALNNMPIKRFADYLAVSPGGVLHDLADKWLVFQNPNGMPCVSFITWLFSSACYLSYFMDLLLLSLLLL
jgi:hypothetical protein